MRGTTRNVHVAGTNPSDGRRLSPSHLAWITAVTLVAGVLLFVTMDPRTPATGLFTGGLDLDVYRDGAWRAVAGLPLYTEPVIHGLLYTYTPFSTLTFIPFGLLPTGIDEHLWLGTNLVLLTAVVLQCWRLLGYRLGHDLVAVSVAIAAGAAFLEPVRTTLFFGQINLVLMLLVLWDVSRGEHSRVKGIGVGLAAGIKLTPAYFVLYYLALRQWRAAAVAVGTFAATIALGWILLPQDSRHYWTHTFLDSSRIANDGHAANQSVRGTLARLLGESTPMWPWLLVSTALVVAGTWVIVRLHRGGDTLLGVTVAGLTATTISPFSWSHHWVWLVPLLVYLLHRAASNPRWWFAVLALFGAAGSWVHREPGRIEVGLYLFPDTWAPVLTANIYPAIHLVVLLGAAAVAVRTPTPATDRA